MCLKVYTADTEAKCQEQVAEVNFSMQRTPRRVLICTCLLMKENWNACSELLPRILPELNKSWAKAWSSRGTKCSVLRVPTLLWPPGCQPQGGDMEHWAGLSWCEPCDTRLCARFTWRSQHSPGLSAEERQAVQGLVIRRPGAAVLSEQALFPLLAQWASCLRRPSRRGLACGRGGGHTSMWREENRYEASSPGRTPR